jgi:hypothetical protein
MSGFIKLRTESNTDLHLAVDEIASWRPYDRYRPNYLSMVTMRAGEVYQVVENTNTIAERIEAAR